MTRIGYIILYVQKEDERIVPIINLGSWSRAHGNNYLAQLRETLLHGLPVPHKHGHAALDQQAVSLLKNAPAQRNNAKVSAFLSKVSLRETSYTQPLQQSTGPCQWVFLLSGPAFVCRMLGKVISANCDASITRVVEGILHHVQIKTFRLNLRTGDKRSMLWGWDVVLSVDLVKASADAQDESSGCKVKATQRLLMMT